MRGTIAAPDAGWILLPEVAVPGMMRADPGGSLEAACGTRPS